MKPSSKNKNAYHIEEDTFQAASSRDCTGLIPALPTTEAELESYEAMYSFLPPGGNDEKKNRDF